MQGTITWFREGEVGQSGKKRPDTFRIGGDERYFNCFDMKNRKIGDTIVFDEKNKPYNNKDQWSAYISDEAPSKDVHADVATQAGEKTLGNWGAKVMKDDVQMSIIAQTLTKCVAEKMKNGSAIPMDELRKETWEDYQYFLKQQKPEEVTTKEPF